LGETMENGAYGWAIPVVQQGTEPPPKGDGCSVTFPPALCPLVATSRPGPRGSIRQGSRPALPRRPGAWWGGAERPGPPGIGLPPGSGRRPSGSRTPR
jgi:hypothetical protein